MEFVLDNICQLPCVLNKAVKTNYLLMKKIAYKSLFWLFGFGVLLVGCDDFLETNPENNLVLDDVISNPVFAEGWLLKAYKNMPNNYTFNEDIVSDDATSNNRSDNTVQNHLSMNQGGWTSSNNPVGNWDKAYESILYLNTFLGNVDDVEWAQTEELDQLFRQRLKGEAYGLRAWWYFELLQKASGIGSNGQLLGFPIVDEVITDKDEFRIPRSSFEDCVNFILADCEEALKGLPDKYVTLPDESVEYNRVMNERWLNRISGLAVRLIQARVALYAASPAYNPGNDPAKWERAALLAADLMDKNNGLSINPADVTFYLNFQSPEILWSSTRRTTGGRTNWEKDNFPPSLFGEGRLNPSQNLVDAFPMSNGYPITDEVNSGYDSSSPYSGRDPRLEHYILLDQANFGGKVITTKQGSNPDGLASGVQSATITGYYLKKFLNTAVRIDPATPEVGSDKFYTYARYTEVLLIFAEAANELGGPDAVVGGYSARQVINAIRARAGINNTAYVDGLDQAGMRQLIRNERRIELAFEGHRFWDIRRWSLTETMNESIYGMSITDTDYNTFRVEGRNYSDFTIYGPIPYNETLKYDIVQNQGW